MGNTNPSPSTRFSKENQPPNESKCVPKTNSKTILNRLLAFEKKMTNPLNGADENLSILEIMYLKQIAQALQGDLASFKEIMDRHEGKAKQTIESENKNIEVKTVLLGIDPPEGE